VERREEEVKWRMERLYIGGERVESTSTQAVDVENPALEEVFAQVPEASDEDVERAVAAAQSAQRVWYRMDSLERAGLLHECARRLEENDQVIGEILCREGGKTLEESVWEVNYVVALFRHNAEIARANRGRVVGPTRPGQMNVVIREPIGVVGLILPTNYPIGLLAWQLAPALAAGNGVVIKPPMEVPLCVLKLAEIFDHLPSGLINVITGGAPAGDKLVKHPKVRMVGFTGSVGTGAAIMAAAAPRIKKLLLELGGSDPFIVLDDAKIDVAARAGMFAAFYNSGQVCTSSERFFIQDGVYDEFMGRSVRLAEAIKVGDPLDPTVNVGSMISARARDKAAEQVQRLVAGGGRIVTGGGPPKGLDKGYYFAPTIIELDADNQPTEEIFGPVAAVTRVRDLDHAIELANASDYGLGATVYTASLEHAMRAAHELEAGTVWINDVMWDNDASAFGGQKLSGLGREMGFDGLEAFSETKHIHIDFAQQTSDWWFPNDERAAEVMANGRVTTTTGV